MPKELITLLNSHINLLEPSYDMNSLATRKFISGSGNSSMVGIQLKLKDSFFYKIQLLVNDKFYYSIFDWDQIILDYLTESEIISHLNKHDIEINDKNIESVRMLAFEATNLSIKYKSG